MTACKKELMDTLELYLTIGFALILLCIRCLAPFWIARAAQKRGRGYVGWIISGLIFGPAIVSLVYLCTAHRAPILLGRERDPIF